MQVSVVVNGTDADAESMWDWLQQEPDLRGLVGLHHRPVSAETMGVSADVIIAIASGSTATALMNTLRTWIVNRRSDVEVTIIAPDGTETTVTAKRVIDPEAILRLASQLPTPAGTTADRVSTTRSAEQ